MEERMSLEARLALKARLEKVLSEILSDQYDCNIRIKFKPEKDDPAFINRNGGLAE